MGHSVVVELLWSVDGRRRRLEEILHAIWCGGDWDGNNFGNKCSKAGVVWHVLQVRREPTDQSHSRQEGGVRIRFYSGFGRVKVVS